MPTNQPNIQIISNEIKVNFLRLRCKELTRIISESPSVFSNEGSP